MAANYNPCPGSSNPAHSDVLRQEIRDILQQKKSNELVGLEIFYCNAFKSTPFTKTDFRMPYLTIDHVCPVDPPKPWTTDVWRVQDVFDCRVLRKLDNGPECVDDLKKAHSLLTKYIEDQDVHEPCLLKMKETKKPDGTLAASKTDIAYVLALHVFGPLSQKGCILDAHSKNFPRKCPGGCEGTMEKGPTGIGDISIWHGFADILVNQNIPVKILAEEEIEEGSDDSEDVSTYTLNVEVKKNPGFHQMRDPVMEVLAQTITNGFAQTKTKKCLKDLLIPSFACSIDDIMIYAYDPHSDLLACMQSQIPLWLESAAGGKCLNISSIVRVWLYVNFPLFMRPALLDRLETKKSNFHKFAPVSLFHENAKCGVSGFTREDKAVGMSAILFCTKVTTVIPRKRRKPSDGSNDDSDV